MNGDNVTDTRFTRCCKVATVDGKPKTIASPGEVEAAAFPQTGTSVPAQVRIGNPRLSAGMNFHLDHWGSPWLSIDITGF